MQVREEEIGSPEKPSPSRGPGTVLRGEFPGRGSGPWALSPAKTPSPPGSPPGARVRVPEREPEGRAGKRDRERRSVRRSLTWPGPRARVLRDTQSGGGEKVVPGGASAAEPREPPPGTQRRPKGASLTSGLATGRKAAPA